MTVPVPDLTLNPFVSAMQPSATMAMTARARARKREGHPVIGLSAGEPDFDTPVAIQDAAIAAIRDGYTHYTDNPGALDLREAIAQKLLRDNGLTYTPEQILTCNGAKQCIVQAVLALCRPGDEIIIPAPFWVSYPEMARLAGATPVIVNTTAESGYLMDAASLAQAITPKTRMLILCSPSNPTGGVYRRDQLDAIAAVLRDNPHVIVISDEIYEYVMYDAEAISFASLPDMKDRTLTVNGFSKGYAMTGWRLGYVAGHLTFIKAMARLQGQFTSAPSSISQKAGLAALALDRAEIDTMVSAFRKRRDLVLSALRDIPGISCPTPEGAFYVFPQIGTFLGKKAPDGTTIATSEDLCFYLLASCNVALVPGEAFGDPHGLRISYAASEEDLREAMKRIRTGLLALSD